MSTVDQRGRRIGLVVLSCLTLAGSVVIALNQGNGCGIHNTPNNVTAFHASPCAHGDSAAMQLHLESNMTVASVHIYAAFPTATDGCVDSQEAICLDWTTNDLEKAGPSFIGNFTMIFHENVEDDDGDYPGNPFAPTPLNAMPVGNMTVVPGYATATGRWLNTPAGLLREHMVDLDIPDVLLPQGSIWMEIYSNGLVNGINSLTGIEQSLCRPFFWASAEPSNVTPSIAVAKEVPGSLWIPTRDVSLAVQTICANGACCTDGTATQFDCIETTRSDCEANHGIFVREGTHCTPEIDCALLLVEFDSVNVKATRDGVRIDWTTSIEVDTVGFRILREAPDRNAKSLQYVSDLIPAAGAGLSGGSYSFLDNAREAASAVAYYIEDVDTYGRSMRHGPFAVDRTRKADPGPGTRQAPRR